MVPGEGMKVRAFSALMRHSMAWPEIVTSLWETDSGAYQGYRIPPYYDSLIGKLIVHGKNRNECLMRLKRCLSEFVIEGIETTIPLFVDLVKQPDIANGLYNIHWLEKFLQKP